MTRFDVAVVGGGIAGTSVAFFLAARCSVVVLEREATLGYHSTGRSAAVFTECYGKPVVRRLAMASRRFLVRPPDDPFDTPILTERGIAFVAVVMVVSAIVIEVSQLKGWLTPHDVEFAADGKLNATAYIFLTIGMVMIFGGLVWCFWKAMQAADRGNGRG